MAGENREPGDDGRWREAVRRATPAASDDLVDEVAEHLTTRWQAARDRGASAEEADRLVHQDLASWRARRHATSHPTC